MKLGTVGNLVPVPPGEDEHLYRIAKVAELGMTVLNVNFPTELPDAAYLGHVRDAAAAHGVELRLGSPGVNFFIDGDEGKRAREAAAARLRTISDQAGITFTAVQGGPMLETHRWVPGPPVPERLALLARTMGDFADMVRDDGWLLGVENHCDFRGHEIATIITTADRPNLRVQLDTGNAFSLFEDPIDCALALAPYTVSVHLKDVAVTPFARRPCMGTRAVAVALGEGDVDNARIVEILQEQAPDPDTLALMFEPFYLPDDVDPSDWLQTNLAWSRANIAQYVS